MSSWWQRDVIEAGKLPLGLCFLAFVVTFVSTRTITRLIRDGRGPFRNDITASGTHVHHAVPGLILLIVGALTSIGGPGSLGWLVRRRASNWHFRVPALHINGGGAASRVDAERESLAAIAFALEGDPRDYDREAETITLDVSVAPAA